jgi:hypothetical protein
MVTIKHRGETRTCGESEWQEVVDRMVRKLGAWEPGVSEVIRDAGESPVDMHGPGSGRDEYTRPAPKPVSNFGAGKQVVDAEAKARIEGQHSALRDAGVKVDASRQLYDTGTRMARVGYENQAKRATEHAAKMPARDAAQALIDAVMAEKRRDVEITSGDLGSKLSINGALRFDGYKMREQAVRGLLGRLKSPALSYVLGLRERMTADDATEDQKASDRAELLDVLKHECSRFDKVPLQLRTRDGLGDVFAIMSPEYAPADAPSVLGDVLAALPKDAKATYAYDPTSTSWEMRASVFTPTPVDEQAVGEAFEGFVSFFSRDNGTRKLGGGGGILLLACLNAGIYEAASQSVSRRHVGRILTDLAALSKDAMAAIRALCQAWGVARGEVITMPNDDKGRLIPIEEAIPGFYRSMLTSRRGELVGVLPGRTATHVENLASAYFGQRRDSKNVVRADLAQGFTRYIQDVPSAVRRDAERAIGQWVVGREAVNYLAA